MSNSVKFKYGTTAEGKTFEANELVTISKGFSNEPTALDKKSGTIYKGDCVVGTSEANHLVLTSDIVVAGGPLESQGKTAFGSTIPAGTTLQDLMVKLFCVEKWPNPVATAAYGTLTSTISAPSCTVPTEDGKCVKIGTSVTLNKVSAANASANSPKLTYDNFTWGYATSTGKHTATSSETNPPSVDATVTTNSVTYTLKKEYTGFGKTSTDTTSVQGADASKLSFDAETVTVALGTNSMKYTLSVSGQVHSATVKDTNVYYALSNLGNTDNSEGATVQTVDKRTAYTYTPNPATPATKTNTNIDIYGVYPVYHNASSAADNLASNTVEVVGTSKDQTTFEISYKGDATNPCSFSWPGDRTLSVQIWNSTFNKWEAPAASNQKTQATETKINNVTYNQWIYTGNALGTGAKFTFTLGKKISA